MEEVRNDGNSDQNALHGLQERILCDYWRLVINENDLGIREQPNDANNFELKASSISMVKQKQFGGYSLKDPNGHISNFIELCGIVKMNGVDHNVIKLNLFPFSLHDKAKNWFQWLPKGLLGDRPKVCCVKYIRRCAQVHALYQVI